MGLRKAMPYAAYDQYEFDIPTREVVILTTVYIVRMEEMRPIAPHLSAGYRKYSVRPDSRKSLAKCWKRPSRSINSIEAPKGELGYYIVSDGTTQPYPCAPSAVVHYLQAFGKWRGAPLSRLVAIIGTIDIVLGEVDRLMGHLIPSSIAPYVFRLSTQSSSSPYCRSSLVT